MIISSFILGDSIKYTKKILKQKDKNKNYLFNGSGPAPLYLPIYED